MKRKRSSKRGRSRTKSVLRLRCTAARYLGSGPIPSTVKDRVGLQPNPERVVEGLLNPGVIALWLTLTFYWRRASLT
jgi:hypothetical protein